MHSTSHTFNAQHITHVQCTAHRTRSIHNTLHTFNAQHIAHVQCTAHRTRSMHSTSHTFSAQHIAHVQCTTHRTCSMHSTLLTFNALWMCALSHTLNAPQIAHAQFIADAHRTTHVRCFVNSRAPHTFNAPWTCVHASHGRCIVVACASHRISSRLICCCISSLARGLTFAFTYRTIGIGLRPTPTRSWAVRLCSGSLIPEVAGSRPWQRLSRSVTRCSRCGTSVQMFAPLLCWEIACGVLTTTTTAAAAATTTTTTSSPPPLAHNHPQIRPQVHAL
jgi:hypothetical protein